MKIGVDIDGVLRNMEIPMIALYNEYVGHNSTHTIESIPSYDITESFPLLDNPFDFFFGEHLTETTRQAPAYPGICDAMRMLHDAGFEVDIISFQPSVRAKIMTLEWLDEHNVYYDNVIFTNNRSKRVVDVDIIIDDCEEYLHESGAPLKMCISHSYNCGGSEWVMVGSISDAVDYILHMDKVVSESNKHEIRPLDTVKIKDPNNSKNGYIAMVVQKYDNGDLLLDFGDGELMMFGEDCVEYRYDSKYRFMEQLYVLGWMESMNENEKIE